jgi:hypothetical protein
MSDPSSKQKFLSDLFGNAHDLLTKEKNTKHSIPNELHQMFIAVYLRVGLNDSSGNFHLESKAKSSRKAPIVRVLDCFILSSKGLLSDKINDIINSSDKLVSVDNIIHTVFTAFMLISIEMGVRSAEQQHQLLSYRYCTIIYFSVSLCPLSNLDNS